MTNQPGPASSVRASGDVVNLPTWGWALRRAVFGLVIVAVVASAGAMLLHASIEPEAAVQQSPSQAEADSTELSGIPSTPPRIP